MCSWEDFRLTLVASCVASLEKLVWFLLRPGAASLEWRVDIPDEITDPPLTSSLATQRVRRSSA